MAWGRGEDKHSASTREGIANKRLLPGGLIKSCRLLYINQALRLLYINQALRLLYINQALRLLYINQALRLLYINQALRLYAPYDKYDDDDNDDDSDVSVLLWNSELPPVCDKNLLTGISRIFRHSFQQQPICCEPFFSAHIQSGLCA